MEAKGLRTKKGKVWFGDARGTRYIRRRMQLVWRGNVAVHKRFNGRQHIRWGVMIMRGESLEEEEEKYTAAHRVKISKA